MRNEDAGPSLPNLDRRKFLIGGALAGTAALTWARQPQNRVDYLGSNKLENIIPKKIGQWDFVTTSGLVVPPEDALSDALYSQLLTRVYYNGSDSAVMLLIAQSAGQTGVLQVHRPEFCYPATGFQLSPIVQRPVAYSGDRRFAVNQLTATQPGRTEQILYWTRVGDSMPISWAQQRLTIAEDNLKGIVPDAVLARVSTIENDSGTGFQRLAEFVEQLVQAMPVAARKVLIA